MEVNTIWGRLPRDWLLTLQNALFDIRTLLFSKPDPLALCGIFFGAPRNMNDAIILSIFVDPRFQRPAGPLAPSDDKLCFFGGGLKLLSHLVAEEAPEEPGEELVYVGSLEAAPEGLQRGRPAIIRWMGEDPKGGERKGGKRRERLSLRAGWRLSLLCLFSVL